jgi:4-hydroxybenzoate polyprenyltransferase
MNGDKKGGRISLPIRYGVKSTKTIIVITIALLLVAVGVLQFVLLQGTKSILSYYSLATISAPLIYLAFKTWNAESPQDFHYTSTLSKVIMLMGILFLIISYYVIFKFNG